MARFQMNDEEGIGIVVSDVKNNFVIGRTHGPRVFNNFDIAKVMCRNILVPKIGFLKYYIQIPSLGIRKSINDCQRINDHYEFFHNGELIQVYEKNTRKAMTLGYLIFDDAESSRLDSEEGNTILHKLQHDVIYAAELCFKSTGNVIKQFNVSNREICIEITNSTAKLHFINISKLMDINQDRRARQEIVFPFRKDLDKYKCFYVMIEKDCSESLKTHSQERAESVINSIMEMLTKQGETVKFEPIVTNKFFIKFENNIEPNYNIADTHYSDIRDAIIDTPTSDVDTGTVEE